MSKISALSDDEFRNIVKSSFSMKECLKKIGYSNTGTDINAAFRRRCEDLSIDTGHFTRKKTRHCSDDEIFSTHSIVTQDVLRKRYLHCYEIPYRCAVCGHPPYTNGIELVLRLDHINGDNHDNRLENLRWLCPNCDSQQDTFCGRNVEWNDYE